jgi:ATP-binding cassette subfamily C protein CydC
MFSAIDLLRMAKPLWLLSFCLGLLTLVSGIALLAYSGWFITAAAIAGVAGSQAGSFNYLRPGAMIRLLAITRTAGRYAERLQSHYTILEVLKKLRLKCFSILSQHFNPYQTLRNGRFNALQQLIADIDILDQYPLKFLLPYAWAFTVLSIAACLLAWWQPLLMGGIALSWLSLLVVLPTIQLLYSVKFAKAEALQQSLRREQMLEQMSALTSMSMLGHSATFLEQFSLTETNSAISQQRLQRTTSVSAFIQQVILVSTAILLIHNQFSASILIACCLAILGLTEVLAPLNQAHIVLGNYQASRNRLRQLSNTGIPPKTSVDFACADIVTFKTEGLAWQFSEVSPLTMTAQANDFILFKGISGCGKSSLFATFAGDLVATSGSISFSGPRDEIVWLDQHPYLFNLSIAANLRLAKPTATDQELHDVLALVELTDWLAKQKNGLSACFENELLGLSGGELRRFALARCLLKPAALMLLDEPFAGLPSTQAERILQRIKRINQSNICFIISHQLQDDSAFTQVISLTHDNAH